MNALDGDAFTGSRVLGDRVESPTSVNSQSQLAGGKGRTDNPRDQGKDRPAPNAKWTYEQRDQIGKMLQDGESARQIAVHFGVSRNAIIGIVGRDPELKKIGFRHGNPIAVTAKARRQAGGKPSKSLREARQNTKREHLHAGNIVRKKESRKLDPIFIDPPVPVIPVEPLMLQLVDLEPRSCRFIVSGSGTHARFCGHESRIGGRYCDHHHGIVYTRHQDQGAA